jgi:hypothetical protein
MSRPIVKIVPDRRRHRRVPVDLAGRFMREDRQEYPCQVINMSAGGMALLAPAICDDGERIVAYLDNLGRIEGVVVRSFEGGFAVRILACLYKRERIAAHARPDRAPSRPGHRSSVRRASGSRLPRPQLRLGASLYPFIARRRPLGPRLALQ